jgi:myo-inositol 2-dehydrogenase / D-chiro-inositol 1-dehydrogenase
MQVSIVGCGRMGRERAKAAAACGVDSILLYDEDRSRAETLATNSACRTKVMPDVTALIEAKPDALFICTPPYCRGPLENRAIGLGMPFFVEKPIGLSSIHARPVLDKLARYGTLNAVGYMNRYRNSVEHVRSILQSRNIIGISAHWVGKQYAVPWWAVREQSGGPFNEQATHLMDLVRYLSGDLEVLHAASHYKENIESTVAVTLRIRKGGLGIFLYSCEASDKDILISIETPEGVLDLRGWDLILERNAITGTYPEPETKPIFEKETAAFLQAVATGNRSLVLSDFAEAYQTQLLMDAVNSILRGVSAAETAPASPAQA